MSFLSANHAAPGTPDAASFFLPAISVYMFALQGPGADFDPDPVELLISYGVQTGEKADRKGGAAMAPENGATTDGWAPPARSRSRKWGGRQLPVERPVTGQCRRHRVADENETMNEERLHRRRRITGTR